MKTDQLSRVLDDMFVQMRGFVRRGMEPLQARIDALESKEAPKDGNDADPEQVAALVRETVEKALADLPAPEPGKDGKDVDQEAVNARIADEVREAVKAIPAPKDGEPGTSVDMAAVRAQIDDEFASIVKAIPMSRDGEPGKDGLPGQDGTDADPEPLKALILDEIAAARAALEKDIAAIPKPKDGENVPIEVVRALVDGAVAKAIQDIPKPKDGDDGEPGRDAFEIDVLCAIDEDKSYQRGTWAKHRGGLWLARSATDGMAGWDCIVEGRAKVELKQSEADPRHIVLRDISSGGAAVEANITIPMVIDQGVYKAGVDYQQGDGVTWSRNYWIAKTQTSAEPGPGPDWRLAVKSGRDGKDGIRGEKGDRGAEGRAGRDLTQMDFDGRRS